MLDELCRNIQYEQFPANTRVFKQGDKGDKLYVVFTGSVAINVQNQLGVVASEVTVVELKRGEYFGERALHDQEPRAASAVTCEMTELVTISNDDYNRILFKKSSCDSLKIRL